MAGQSNALHEAVAARTAEMVELLGALVAIPSVSGKEWPLTQFVAHWAKRQGWGVDLWQAEESELSAWGPLPKAIPLAGRPTLVIRCAGRGGGRSLMFNAHADVVAAPGPERWRFGPWSATVHEGKLFGRGACDTKGPLVSALWAMRAMGDLKIPHAGDLLLELIPGEEDCVGLGTLTSVARGYKTDGVVVLEPTEGWPRCASRGGVRFEITCHGKSVHGTVKWLGSDAIAMAPKVLATLGQLEAQWNQRDADELFAAYPLMRPITVDSIHGGDWQGMICDRCVIAGYLELLPRDEQEAWIGRLKAGLGADQLSVRITERYDGHFTAAENPLCQAAAEASGLQTWSAFNSGCEAGLRAKLLGTPTLVWGPGSLAQAHAVDEYVDLEQVGRVAEQMASLAMQFSGGRS